MTEKILNRPRFRIAGDRGLLVEYGDVIDPDVNRKVRSMVAVIEADRPEGVLEVVPTYRSLLIVYEPSLTCPSTLSKALIGLEERLSEIRIPPPSEIEIPVLYGGEFGPDIEYVAKHNGLTVDQVVAIHSGTVYQIYMVGFTPGFPFLGGLPDVLHTPRLETPRSFVPRGSVGIANAQTGVYPVASPGGWQLIGRTPLRLFAPERSEPFLYKAGDRIRFVPISSEAYHLYDKEG